MSTSARKKARDNTYHHGSLRAALIAAARELVEQEGAAGVTLREAARRAGVSHNAPYRHFESHEALLAAVAEWGFVEFGRRLAAARSSAPPKGALAALGRAYVRFALDHPNVFRLMFSGAIDKRAFPGLHDAAQRSYEALSAAVAARDGRNAAARALAAWSIVHGLAHLLLDGAIPVARASRSELDAMVEKVLRT